MNTNTNEHEKKSIFSHKNSGCLLFARHCARPDDLPVNNTGTSSVVSWGLQRRGELHILRINKLWYIHTMEYYSNKSKMPLGVPGWLSQLSSWLWFRSWSWGLWVWAPHQACCCQHRVCLRSSALLSLLLPHLCTCSLTLSLSKINIFLKKVNYH